MNIKISLPITLLFFVVLICDVFAILTDNQSLCYIFKPLLMPLVAIVYYMSVERVNKVLLGSLFMAWLGDVFLLFDEYFIQGLASFLFTHLLYIIIIKELINGVSWKEILPVYIPFLLYQIGLLSIIYSNVGELLIPVIVYSTVISFFGTASVVNYLKDKNKANLTLLIGAVMFIASDSFLAIRTFYDSWIGYEVLVITLYAVAQLWICRSFVIRANKVTEF